MGSIIKQMPKELYSSVRSGIILYDFTRVVEELVFNSIDSGATKVHVALDVSTCYVKVKDNGSGISRDGLVLVGQRYATSKHDHLGASVSDNRSFGFRGEALCSISDVALLEIVTRTHGMPNGYRKVMKGSKCLYLGISDETFDVGTTVLVRDLFYNQPVRRKHIQSSPKKVLQSVKNCILQIALVHTHILFRVIDVESENQVLSVGPSSSPLTLLTSGFGIDTNTSFRELNRSDGIFKLGGYVSGPCDVTSPKVFQYIYINSRFVCKGPIHKLINQLALRFICVDDWKPESSLHSIKQSYARLSPAFFLNLICQRSIYDITFEPSRTTVEFKDWAPVLTFIENAVTEFWSESEPHALSFKHDFGRKRRRIKEDEGSLQLPTSPPRKLDIDHTTLPFWRDYSDSYEKNVGGASAIEDHVTRDEYFPQVDCLHKSYDKPRAFLGGAIGAGNSNAVHSSHFSLISKGDILLENDFFAPERPFKLVKCSTSTWEEPITLDARLGDISEENFDSRAFDDDIGDMREDQNPCLEESFNCRAFDDGIGDMRENQNPHLDDGLSSQRLLGYESPFEEDDSFRMRTECFRTKHKWDAHDNGFHTGGLDNLDKIISARSSVHGDLQCSRSFLSSRIQHSKKIYDDSFSENQRNPFSSPSSMNEYEEYHLPSDSVKPMGEYFDSRLSSIPSDPFFGVRLQADFCRDEDEVGTLFKSDQILSDGYSDITGKGWYSGFSMLDEIEENCGSSTFRAREGHVDSRDDFWEPRDSYMRSNTIDKFDRISSLTTGHETCTKFPITINYSSSIDCQRNLYGSHIQRQVKQSDSRKREPRCHSAPPIYKGRKRFLAVGDLSMMSESKPKSSFFHDKPFLTEHRVKHAPNYSKSSTWRSSSPSPIRSQLLSVENPATVISDVETSSGNAMIQDYEPHGKDNAINVCHYDPREDCKLKIRKSVSDCKTNQQDVLPNTAERKMPLKHENEASILDIFSGILHLSGDSLVPNSVDKSFLERAKVLQQVDKKYIPVVGCKVLAIIDQHAADERIRLEELRKQVLSGEMKTISYLETEQDLVLPEIGFQLLHDYAKEMHSWGWICNIHSHSSESFTKNMKILHSHPTVTRLLAVPCILGVNLTDEDMLEYLQQLADTDGSSTIPPAVNRILNNKSCRGAIMFGDALLPSECSLIVEELKRTSLCFQCAHGRPTTVPLVNMDVLHKQIAKLRLASNSSDGAWHGLRRNKVSLERASRRVS